MDRTQLFDMMRTCTLVLNNESIVVSDYLRENMLIVSEAFSKLEPSRSITVAPDIEIPFYAALLGAVFVALKSADETDALSKLKPSDLVILDGRTRCKFLGVNETHFMIQYTDQGMLTHSLRLADAHRIAPYDGGATSLDGRGVRSDEFKLRKRFFDTLLGEGIGKMYLQPSSSVLIVCPRSFADTVCDMELEVAGVRATLKLLFPSSYYTQDSETQYAGNALNLPSVLKFAGSFSVARDLVVDDSRIKILLVPQGHEYTNHLTEFEDIWSRKSLKYIFIINSSGKTGLIPFASSRTETDVYAWTKKALESKIDDTNKISKNMDSITRRSYHMLTNAVHSEVKVYRHDTPVIGMSRCISVLEELKSSFDGKFGFLRNIDSFSTSERFAAKALSAFRVLRQTPCPLSMLDNSPYDIQALLSEMLDLIDIDSEKSVMVFDCLSSFAKAIAKKNDRWDTFCEILNGSQGKVAIVIAQPGYENILKNHIPVYARHRVIFKTPSSLTDSDSFAHVVFMGLFEYDKLNPWNTLAAPVKHVLIYDFEEKYFNRQHKTHKNTLRQLSRANNIFREDMPEEVESDDMSKDISLPDIYSISSPLWSIPPSIFVGEGDLTVEIERVVRFATGEQAYFTKFYSAYVFNESRGSVDEKPVSELRSGDRLIFTTFDGATRDIVTRIVEKLLDSKALDEKQISAWHKALRWKTLLRSYRTNNGLKFEQLSQLLKQNGQDRHVATIRSWIDDDSHIIGPREVDTFVAVAKVTEDLDMLKSPEIYKQACDTVRSLRVRLLKRLSKYVVARHTNKQIKSDNVFDSVVSDISNMSRILEIDEVIVPEGLTVPTRISNTPIEI